MLLLTAGFELEIFYVNGIEQFDVFVAIFFFALHCQTHPKCYALEHKI